RANVPPRYRSPAPVPELNPPPWIHTITGRGSPPSPLDQMLRVRQSSDCSSGAPPTDMPGTGGVWGARGPRGSHPLIPVDGSAASGGCQRRGPTGGAAEGIPENDQTPFRSTP